MSSTVLGDGQYTNSVGTEATEVQRVAARCHAGNVMEGISLVLQVVGDFALEIDTDNKAGRLGGRLKQMNR